VAVVTGESPYTYLADFLCGLAAKTGVTFRVVPVKNSLFGDSVTVTGLVPGKAILDVVSSGGFSGADLVLVPDVMLKEGEEVFIDDVSLEDLRTALGVVVEVCEATPSGLYNTVHRHCST